MGRGNRVNGLIAVWMIFLLPGGCTQYENISTSYIPSDDTIWYDFEIVNTYPHDPEAFTQGLLFRDGYLYESTGLRGRSTVRKTDLETGEIIKMHELDPEYFGEGLTDMDDRLYQLTLNAGICFAYDLESFAIVDTFHYEGYGWGLANDGSRLIMSDGSSELRFLDPVSFHEIGIITVTEHGNPVENVNEMVMVGDHLFANILHTNHIAIIDPETGIVEARIDLGELRRIARDAGNPINVMNGIAYDELNDRLFVTGKLWPYLFEIKILPKE
jgi:glutaminyl-peptide cyclotransferase